MGKLGDRIQSPPALIIALLYSVCLYILCAQHKHPYSGLASSLGSGQEPYGISLLNRLTSEGISRIFSWHAHYLGGIRANDGIEVFSVHFGYHWVFYGTAFYFTDLMFLLFLFRSI